MNKALLGVLLAWALALAGCSGGSDGHDTVDITCPDGTVLTAEDIEADEHHHDAGFNATQTMCPVPPKVILSGLPATIQVYDSAAFTWAVDPGSITKGHSLNGPTILPSGLSILRRRNPYTNERHGSAA